MGIFKGELKFKSLNIKSHNGEDKKLSGLLPAISLIFYVFYMTSSIFWSDNIREYFSQFEKLVPFYLLAIILFIDGIDKYLNINEILDAFLWGVLVALGYMVIMMGLNCFMGSTIGTIKVYGILGLRLFDYIQHYTYLGTTLLMAVPLLMLKSITTTGGRKLSLFVLATFICLLCISSYGRIVMLLALIVPFVSFYLIWGRQIRLRWLIIIASGIMSIGLLVVVHSPRIVSEFTQLTTSNKSIEDVESRSVLWRTAFNLIKQRPVFGYGMGNHHQIFIEENARFGNELVFDKKYNVHNQYLETLLSGGLLGLVLLLLIFILIVSKQKDNRNLRFRLIVCCFFIVYGIGFITESMLQRNIGVFPVVFWCFILALNSCNKSKRLLDDVYFKKLSILPVTLFLIIFGIAYMLPIDEFKPRTYMIGNYKVIKYSEVQKWGITGHKNVIISISPRPKDKEQQLIVLCGRKIEGKDSVHVHFSMKYNLETSGNIGAAMININDGVNGELKYLNLNDEGMWKNFDISFNVRNKLFVYLTLYYSGEINDGKFMFLSPEVVLYN